MRYILLRSLCLGVLFAILPISLLSQVDSSETQMMNKLGKTKSAPNQSVTQEKKDVPEVKETTTDSLPKKKLHSPRKAGIYSAILPGLGQAYNRKYWKIGVIGAGTAALVYSYQFSLRNYRLHKNELILRQSDAISGFNENLALYSDGDLNELQDFYRRNRDLTVIGFALLYTLNIIDATVDAHFFDFNMSDDLSLQIRPEPVYNAFSARSSLGLGINLRF
jgi:hypothetical protein